MSLSSLQGWTLKQGRQADMLVRFALRLVLIIICRLCLYLAKIYDLVNGVNIPSQDISKVPTDVLVMTMMYIVQCAVQRMTFRKPQPEEWTKFSSIKCSWTLGISPVTWGTKWKRGWELSRGSFDLKSLSFINTLKGVLATTVTQHCGWAKNVATGGG